MKRQIIEHLVTYIEVLEREARNIKELNQTRELMSEVRTSINGMTIADRQELCWAEHYMTEHGDLIKVIMDEEDLRVRSISVVDYQVLESNVRST